MRTIHLPYDITPLPIPRRSTRVGAKSFFRKVSRWIALFRLDGELEMASGQAWAYERLVRIGMERLEYTDPEDYAAQCREIEFNRQQQLRAAREVVQIKLRINEREHEGRG